MLRVADKYDLLRKLAAGGMAEVFLARQTGVEGFEKLVALKRIHPGRTEEPGFVDMFLDEARTAARLRHPNIVDVYEVLNAEGTWWIAMEWLRGEDVRRVMTAAGLAGQAVPLAVAIQIVMDAARGLDHAHRTADLQARPLGLVHRDVSPQNLVVTRDGITKVVDFGIAKAAHRRSEDTQEGMVKGKLLYMSPEQARGEEIDHRSDQFSLAIVLYELATLRRFHARGSEAATLRALLEGNLPTGKELLPEYPGRAQEILGRALSPDREKRFPSCSAFADALEEFLDEARLPHSSGRVSRLMRALFGGELPEVAAESEPTTKVVEFLTPDVAIDAARAAENEPPRRTSNVPEDTDVLFGRQADLERLSGLCEGGHLVTVLGPAGSGKTRIALRHGAMTKAAYPGGTWLFRLAEARSGDDICRIVARELGVEPSANEDTAALIGRVFAAKKSCLAIFDNLEQVTDSGGKLIRKWIAAAPSASFLVTSRERLKFPGERVLDLGPLSSSGVDSPAVELFIHRGRATRPQWSPSSADLAIIEEIVRRLEGIPLAIELAASRLGVLSPAKLLDRLPQGIGLVGGKATSRHATLRGALDWSWSLLAPWEQSALAQVAVFRGGFDLEAAEAVVDLSTFPEAPWTIDVLIALNDKSLLRVQELDGLPGELRYDLYMVVREHALSMTTQAELEPTEARHGRYFSELGRRLCRDVSGHGGQSKLRALEREADNIEAARARALDASVVRVATDAAIALEPVVGRRSPRAYLDMLDQVVARPEEPELGVDERVRLRLLRAAARRVCGQPDRAIADLSEALRLARGVQDEKTLVADVLMELGVVEHWRGNIQAANIHLEEALELVRAARDRRREGPVSSLLAAVISGRDPSRALTLVERGLLLSREAGDRQMESRSLGILGYLRRHRGEPEEAEKNDLEALAICRQLGDREKEADYHFGFGLHRLSAGFLSEARVELDRALHLAQDVGNVRTQGYVAAYQAILGHLEGHIPAALARHRDAVALFESIANARMITFFGILHSFALAEAGELPAASAQISRAEAEFGGSAEAAQMMKLANAAVRLRAEENTLADARMCLEQCARRPAEGVPLMETSDDLRIAAQLLRRAIERLTPSSGLPA